MKHDKNSSAASRPNDDVGRLFDKLGSAGAGLYQDFEPSRLPSVRQAEAPRPAAAPAVDAPLLAQVCSLRPEPAAEPAAAQPALASTPLDELFRRLLQAEAAAPSSGVLKRMFAG